MRCDVSPQAGRRWCLSGTPIQNSVDDLYSCFRFLRYNPYCKRAAFKTMLKDPLQDDPAKGAQLLQVCLKVSDIGLSAQAFCILHCQSWSWQSNCANSNVCGKSVSQWEGHHAFKLTASLLHKLISFDKLQAAF